MENIEVLAGTETVTVIELVDIWAFAERGEEVPHAKAYHVRIDGETFKTDTHCPTVKSLLEKVGKRPCAFELIEELAHHENNVLDPDETANLRKPGLKGFLTAHKEKVTIFIGNTGHEIERGDRTVAEILAKDGKPLEGYILLEEKDGPPLPVPSDKPVKICGCEKFHIQVDKSGSS